MTFHRFLGPNPRLTPLDEGSYTLDGAVGFPILHEIGPRDRTPRSLVSARPRIIIPDVVVFMSQSLERGEPAVCAKATEEA